MGAKLAGPAGGKTATIDTLADMNVTPLVDVMLVLLIIFMVAAPLATTYIPLDVPPAKPSPLPSEPPTVVSLQQSGALYIGQQETGLVSLAADLTRTLGGPDPAAERIYVRADGDVAYLDFMAVMNALHDGGFYEVAIIGENLESRLLTSG